MESDPVWGATTAAERICECVRPQPEPRSAAAAPGAGGARRPGRRPASAATGCCISGGERKALDIKKGGLLPIEALARWSGLAAGVGAATTRARIEASEAAGTLSSEHAAILRDAFELVCELRMEHQVDQLRGGRRPTT